MKITGKLMVVTLLTVFLGFPITVDVTADETNHELTAVGNQDVTLKTDGANESYFVVAIPQEIVMTKDEDSMTDYSGTYVVQAKGILASGTTLRVAPTDASGESPLTKMVDLTSGSDPSTANKITATITQAKAGFLPNGRGDSDICVEISPTEFRSISGNSVTKVTIPGTYTGTVGFTVQLVGPQTL